MNPTADDFRKAIRGEFNYAKEKGMLNITLVSGYIHRKVGGYPGSNHRMPLCCNVMKDMMRLGDVVLKEPPSGQGASLKINYIIPK